MKKELYTVVETSKVMHQAGRIHHVRLGKETENGELIIAGEIEPDNLDVREGIVPEEGAGNVALIADPVKIYDETTYDSRNPNRYIMPEGHVARAYVLKPTDLFAVTKAGFENPEELDEFKAGETELYATVGAEGKMKLVAEEPADGFYAKVVQTRLLGGVNASIFSATAGQEPEVKVYLDVKSN